MLLNKINPKKWDLKFLLIHILFSNSFSFSAFFFVSWSLSVFLTFHLYLSLFISIYLCLSFLCPPSPRAITAQKNVWVLPKQILKTDVKEAKKLHSSKKSKWTKKGMFSTSFFAKAQCREFIRLKVEQEHIHSGCKWAFFTSQAKTVMMEWWFMNFI